MGQGGDCGASQEHFYLSECGTNSGWYLLFHKRTFGNALWSRLSMFLCVGDTGFNIVNGRHCEVIRIGFGYYAGQVRLLHADEDPDNFRSSSWLRLGLFRPVDKRARIRGPDEGSGTLSLPPLRGSLVKTTSVQIVTQSPDWKPTDTDGNITAVGAKRSVPVSSKRGRCTMTSRSGTHNTSSQCNMKRDDHIRKEL